MSAVENIISKISPDNLSILSEQHIRRYEKMLASHSSYVRKSECKQYAAIWRSIRDKKGQELTSVERNEVYEAITSGEYDDLLSSEST